MPPYKFAKYLPMRICASDYLRQMINSYEIHFVVAKKKSQFRIKTQIGPFICSNMAMGEEADILLKQMKFPLIFTWSYDPFGIIFELRTKQKTTSYVHTQSPKVERYMN
jgi:hypothetical protein